MASRLKYPDQADKFAESEIELHEEIEKLKIFSSGPQFYPELVNLNAILSILGLLSHENTDIAVNVVVLLQDLTDEDVLEDNDEPAQILVDALVENNVLELLAHNLHRLSDTDPNPLSKINELLLGVVEMVRNETVREFLKLELTRHRRRPLSKPSDSDGLSRQEQRTSDDEIWDKVFRQVQCLRQHYTACRPRPIYDQIQRADLGTISRPGFTISTPRLSIKVLSLRGMLKCLVAVMCSCVHKLLVFVWYILVSVVFTQAF